MLESFSVDCENEVSAIHWTTSSEQNSDYFELERSNNGFDWELISKTTAAGNSNQTINYNFTDSEFRSISLVYYRLVLVNQDGERETFDALSSNCLSDTHQFYLYPNPANDKIKIVTSENGSSILFRDMRGRIVKEVAVPSTGNQLIDVSVADLSKGSYFVELQMENGQKDVLRFVKN